MHILTKEKHDSERISENDDGASRTIKTFACSCRFFPICRNYSTYRLLADCIAMSTIHGTPSTPARIERAGNREARRDIMAEAQAKKMGLVQWLLIGIVVAGGLYMFFGH